MKKKKRGELIHGHINTSMNKMTEDISRIIVKKNGTGERERKINYK